MKYIVLLLLTFCLLATPVCAENQAVEMTATDSIAWRKSENAYIATGEAEASKGDTHLQASTITAIYRDMENGSTEIYDITAQTNAQIDNKDMTGKANTIHYKADTETVRMTGAPLVLESNNVHMTASKSITIYDKPRRVELDGNARILRKTDDTVMTATHMVAHFSSHQDGEESLQNIDAAGDVTLVSDKLVSRSDNAIYHADTDEAILTGHVKITRDDSQLGGDKAIINLTSGDSRILAADTTPDGRVRALFIPEDANKEDSAP